MPITPPSERNWWDIPIGKHEKIWLTLVVVTALALFIMMPVWHVLGSQNPSTTSYRVDPRAYFDKVNAWAQGTEKSGQGVKTTGQDVYLVAMKWAWYPNTIVLDTGVSYRIHISSLDVNHGFSLHQDGKASQKVNFQVVPAYEYILTMKFSEPGVYHIICQEYCGIDHESMVGQFVVEGGNQ